MSGQNNDTNILEVRNLTKHFKIGGHQIVHAVDGVSFNLKKGRTLGLVGESGCGKSTCARTIIRMYDVTDGKVILDGTDITSLNQKALKPFRKKMQMIFQDPYASLNARMTVRDIIAEPLIAHKLVKNKEEANELVYPMLKRVGLTKEHANRYPHEFSGGQRQRVGIARALVLQPDLIICDEPISALDVSIQAQVINLMQDIKKEFSLTYMFISHDLRIIKHFCDRVMVMYLGNIVEIGTKDAIYEKRRHPYTQALLSAIPNIRKQENEHRILLTGDIPSPVNPPSGCPFHPRCRYCMDICKKEKPQLKTMADGTQVACHLNIE